MSIIMNFIEKRINDVKSVINIITDFIIDKFKYRIKITNGDIITTIACIDNIYVKSLIHNNIRYSKYLNYNNHYINITLQNNTIMNLLSSESVRLIAAKNTIIAVEMIFRNLYIYDFTTYIRNNIIDNFMHMNEHNVIDDFMPIEEKYCNNILAYDDIIFFSYANSVYKYILNDDYTLTFKLKYKTKSKLHAVGPNCILLDNIIYDFDFNPIRNIPIHIDNNLVSIDTKYLYSTDVTYTTILSLSDGKTDIISNSLLVY